MIQAKGKGGPQANNPSQLLPSELIDRCIGSQIWVILKGMPHVAPQHATQTTDLPLRRPAKMHICQHRSNPSDTLAVATFLLAC